jgi:hypothetical protein
MTMLTINLLPAREQADQRFEELIDELRFGEGRTGHARNCECDECIIECSGRCYLASQVRWLRQYCRDAEPGLIDYDEVEVFAELIAEDEYDRLGTNDWGPLLMQTIEPLAREN